MKQPAGSASNAPTLPTSVVLSDEIVKVIDVLLSVQDIEHICKNAVSNALDGKVNADYPELFEFDLPSKNVSVLYQFRDDFCIYMIAAIDSVPVKAHGNPTKSPMAKEVDAQIRQLRKLKVGVHPRDFVQWLLKRFFRRHDD